jgi:MFS family permease
MANVCAATLVMTRTQEHLRGRVSAALWAVLNAASVASLAAGGALAAVLDPRQVYLLAGGLGGVVTVLMAVPLAWRLGTGRGHSDISFAPEQSRA